MEQLVLNITIVRAHPYVASTPKERSEQDAQALGQSRGSFSTKIPISVDALGNMTNIATKSGSWWSVSSISQALSVYFFAL